MRLGRDGIAGLIGLAVSLALLPFAFGLPKLPIVPVGPGFYPIIVLVFMALTSAVLVVQDLIAHRRAPAAVPAEAAERSPSAPMAWSQRRSRRRAPTSSCCRCSAFASRRPLFVAAFQMVLERPHTLRQWAMLAAIAVGTAVVTLLGVRALPARCCCRAARWTGW